MKNILFSILAFLAATSCACQNLPNKIASAPTDSFHYYENGKALTISDDMINSNAKSDESKKAKQKLIVEYLAPSMDENQEAINVQLYPKKSSNFLILKIPEVLKGAKFTIFDLEGIMIYSFNIRGDRTSIPVKKIKPGKYVVSIDKDDINYSYHLIKSN